LVSSYGLTKEDINIVMNKQKEGLQQVACLRLFEGAHKGGVSEHVGSHPNGYFTSSQQYTKDVKKSEDKKTGAPVAAASAPKAEAEEPKKE